MGHRYPFDYEDDRELYDDSLAVISAHECTGLIPSAPNSEYNTKSYSDIYDVPLADDELYDRHYRNYRK